jgi:acid phosphatase family membrane protein YuiD
MLGVCRHAPLLVLQILTVLLYDADTIQAESGQKAIELNELL